MVTTCTLAWQASHVDDLLHKCMNQKTKEISSTSASEPNKWLAIPAIEDCSASCYTPVYRYQCWYLKYAPIGVANSKILYHLKNKEEC